MPEKHDKPIDVLAMDDGSIHLHVSGICVLVKADAARRLAYGLMECADLVESLDAADEEEVDLLFPQRVM